MSYTTKCLHTYLSCNISCDSLMVSQSPDSEDPPHVTATITTAETTTGTGERRPSWRLKVDNGSKVHLACLCVH